MYWNDPCFGKKWVYSLSTRTLLPVTYRQVLLSSPWETLPVTNQPFNSSSVRNKIKKIRG